MNKMFAVLKREYLQAVRKKSFIIVTIAMPVLMAALFFLPTLLLKRALGEKKVILVDGSGRLEQAVKNMSFGEVLPAKTSTEKALTAKAEQEPEQLLDVSYVNAAGQELKAAAAPYLDRLNADATKKAPKIDGVLVVPASVFENSDTPMTYYSRSSADLIAQERLGRLVNAEIQKSRLEARGIARDDVKSLLSRTDVEAVQLTRSSVQKKGGEMNFRIGFLFAALLLIPSLIYGLEVMRGVIQEKTDRVVEVLISSVTPMQLLSGKILGLAAVGLTQLSAWLVMAALFGIYSGGFVVASEFNLFEFLTVPVAIYFLVFFILGYLIYVCFYAIAGAVCNSEKDAQQFIQPVMFVLMLPWFLMLPIIMNPDSMLSVVLSLFPLFAPITMFVRILVSDPPVWHIGLAIAFSVATIWGLFWVTAKIFRLGILSYGKRPTIPELVRWLRQA